MKRLGALILALALLLSATAMASVLPEADKTLLQAGETVQVTVKLDAPIEGVYGMSYKLYFDQNVFDYDFNASAAGDAISGVQASVKAMTDAEGKQYVLIQYVDLTAQGQTVAAGSLYTLAFTAKSEVTSDAPATFLLQKGKVRDTSRNEITGDAVEVPADKASLTVTVQAAPSTEPTLALGEEGTQSAWAGREIQVPVSLRNTPTLGMAAFVVRYDGTRLAYAGADLTGGVAEGNLSVVPMAGSDNCLVVSTLGMPVMAAGRLCTLKFTVKDTAVAGETAAIELPEMTADDATYPMVLDANMAPVAGMRYQALTVNIVETPQVTGISLDKTELTLKAGQQQTLTATVEAEEGADSQVTWESDAAEIAQVDENGTVTALSAGEAVITARAGDKAASCRVQVVAVSGKGYTVRFAEETQTVNIAQEASVGILVGVGDADARTTYNAVDMVLRYDAEKLAYTGETRIGDLRISDDGAGQLKLVRYGEDALINQPLVTLKFTARAAGEARVEFVSAKVDESANASMQDAPEAQQLGGAAVITVGGYLVTLPDIFEGEGTTTPGQDYTFRASDAAHYDYSDVKATIGGAEVEVIDNGDGTYTVKAENITGDLVITGQRTPKTYSVTFAGTGAGDVVDPSNQATYGVDYAFTVQEDANYRYTVTAKLGETEVPVTAGGNGSYTIPGNRIEGDLVITVTKESGPIVDPSQQTVITIEGVSAEEVEGGRIHTAPNGADYTIRLVKDAAYDYTLRIGETVLQANADGSYTIPGSMLTGEPVTVTVEKTVAAPKVEVAEYLKLDKAEAQEGGRSMWLVLITGTPVDGSTYVFDGETMFVSEKYEGAYCYLMISGKTLAEVQTDAAALVTQKSGAARSVAYDGDVNGTAVVDVNDAQLVYDMYLARYGEFTQQLPVEAFLKADMDGSRSITVKDAAEIVARIHGEFPAE